MEILRYIVLPGLAGALAGLVAAAGLVFTNVAHLLTLMQQSSDGWVGGVLLAWGFMVTFGSVSIGATIMSLGEEDRPFY